MPSDRAQEPWRRLHSPGWSRAGCGRVRAALQGLGAGGEMLETEDVSGEASGARAP